MNQIFNTPKDAYQACDAELNNSWQNFVAEQNLVEADNPEAFKATYYTFKTGFKAGATFISSLIVNKLQTK